MNSIIPPVQQYPAYRWVMLAGISLLYGCFSLVHFSTASLASHMMLDLDLDLVEMGMIMGAWPLAYVFLSIPTGLLLDRFGVRFILLFGIVMLALSAYGRVVALDREGMFFAMLMFGLGAPCISIGTPKLIRNWFAYRQRGLALGVCSAMVAAGSVLGLTLSQELLQFLQGGWRSALLVYAQVCAVSAFLWLLIILHPQCKLHDGGSSEESLAQLWSGCMQLLFSPSIWITLVLSVGIFFYMHATINWLPKLLTHINPLLSVSESAYWASLPIVISIISAAVIPRFTNNNRETLVMALLFFTACASCILLNLGSAVLLMTVALTMVGIVRGALPPAASLLMMHMPGINQKNIGAGMGLFFAFGQIGGVSGPVVFGYLAQRSGGFNLPLYVLAALCLILAALSIKIGADNKNVENKPDDLADVIG